MRSVFLMMVFAACAPTVERVEIQSQATVAYFENDTCAPSYDNPPIVSPATDPSLVYHVPGVEGHWMVDASSPRLGYEYGLCSAATMTQGCRPLTAYADEPCILTNGRPMIRVEDF